MLTTEALQTELARRDFLEFVVQTSYSDYHVAPCHAEMGKVINQFVADIEAGLRPMLIISISPRSGKSHMVSERLPLYLLGKHPDWEIVSCSYSAELATKFTFRALELLREEAVQRIFPNLQLNPNKQKQNHWETNKGGSYKGVGVGGSLTGSGAHCFPKGTMVNTSEGLMDIAELHYLWINKKDTPLILSFNHKKSIFEYKKLKATQVLNADLLYKTRTVGGSETISTGNHPFNTSLSKGIYTNIDRLSLGDEVFVLSKGFQERQSRIYKSLEEGVESELLLFCDLFENPSLIQELSNLSPLQVSKMCKRSAILLQNLSKRSLQIGESFEYCHLQVSKLFEVFCSEGFEKAVLFKNLCEYWTLYSNEGGSKLTSSKSLLASLRIQFEETDSIEKRFEYLCVLCFSQGFGYPSYRPQLSKQLSGELNYALSVLPYNPSQIKGEPISILEPISCGEVEVFDIEVEDNHNFFADGFLVHNCLIADDTVKDWEAAMSPRERDRVWDWWTSVAYTRLYPKSGVILCQTRWSVDDLTGRVLAKQREEGNYNVYTLNFPAIATRDEYPLVRQDNTWVEDITQDPLRKAGEALHPERYPLDMLLQIKANSERVWQALYQGDPRPDGGRYIQTGNIRYIVESDLPKEQSAIRWVRGYDLAVKAGRSHDHSASALLGADKRGNLYLKHVTNVKKTWNENKKFIVGMAKAERIRMAIETVAAFHLAYIELKNELKGVVHISEVKATTDKLTRALGWIDKIEAGCFYIVVQSEEEYTSGVFNLTKWVTPLLEQMQNFDPDVKDQADDQLDAISVAYADLFIAKKPRVII